MGVKRWLMVMCSYDHGIERRWRSMEAFALACSVPLPRLVGGGPASTCFKYNDSSILVVFLDFEAHFEEDWIQWI